MNRRFFVKSAALAGASLSTFSVLRGQSAPAAARIRLGIIGSGGRATAITKSFLNAAALLNVKVEFVAVADVFEDRIQAYCEKFEIPAERGHAGFSSYQRVAESNADIILTAAPPAFRPLHLDACIEAGKHCFVEKPVGVDPVGARRIMAIGELAQSKGLNIVAGTQRRYDLAYRSAYQQIAAGAIGDILGGAIYWNGRVPWISPRKDGQSDALYLARNWLNFTELSGDHIVEQHIHQIDVANWFMGRPPRAFLGMGGRARRETGNQYDFFSVDFDYGDGVHILSQCRQISGCYNRVGESFRGSKGFTQGTKVAGDSPDLPSLQQEHPSGQIQEQVDLLKGVLGSGPYRNDAHAVAESTLCAVGARISAYTGQIVRWIDLTENVNSPLYSLQLAPSPKDFESDSVLMPAETPPIPGSADGLKVNA
jgi:myo-inositol 2-dehydrogenase/D-chiro-inositol 1-dehydrogenase